MFDVKISNGKIVDGSGKSAFMGDIGVIGDKIAAVGNLENSESKLIIDAKGNIVCPGFIDMHTHSDLSIVYDHHANARIYSGVTTEVIGNCGIGVAPVNPDKKQLLIDYLGTRLIGSLPVEIQLNWNSFEEYLDYVDSINPSVNIAPLLAQGAVRIAEMGFSKEKPSSEGLEKMKDRVRKAMSEGAIGLTSGLVYMPGEYTSTEELIELCKEIKPFGGYYTSHIRNEGREVFAAVEEAITIGKKSGVPVHISHLKIMGNKSSEDIDKLLERLENAKNEGIEVTFDVYPYTAGQTSLSALMPPWCFEGGVGNLVKRLQNKDIRRKIINDIEAGIPGWNNFAKMANDWSGIIIATISSESNKYLEGKSIEEISKLMCKDPYETVFDLIIAEEGKVQIVLESMREEDVEKIISHKGAMIGSDSMCLSTEGILSSGKPHPRYFGTQAKILSKYVREKQLISIEDAINRMTLLSAKRLGINNRGLLKEDYYADIVIFNPNEVQDKATYVNPKQYSEGISTVIVNGQLVLENSQRKEVFPGRVLRRKNN